MTANITTHGLITVVDGHQRLVGAGCGACGTHTFPVQAACPRCGAAMDPVALPAAGTVWTWTVQRILPKPPYRGPDAFEPYAVGYIDLGIVRIESRLEGKPPDTWQIGDSVHLQPGAPDDHGHVWTYRFVSDGDPL